MADVLTLAPTLVAAAREVLLAAETAGVRLATAESCTGGLLAAALTETPGSSRVVEQAVVSYSNRAKADRLRVPVDLLAEEGAVSGAVVEDMLEDLLSQAGVDLGIAISGIAGPGGGSDEKPVGLVWFAVGAHSIETQVESQVFDGDRAAIRHAAVLHACTLLTKAIAAIGAAPTNLDAVSHRLRADIAAHVTRAIDTIPRGLVDQALDVITNGGPPSDLALIGANDLALFGTGPSEGDDDPSPLEAYIEAAIAADLFTGPVTPAALLTNTVLVLRIDRIHADQPIAAREALSGDAPIQLVDVELKETLAEGAVVAVRCLTINGLAIPAGPTIDLDPGEVTRLKREYPKPPNEDERNRLAALIFATRNAGISIEDALDAMAEEAPKKGGKRPKPSGRR
ncbi:MAG: CinA family protein [Alphaproteobacteria bacterium]|nr:CinA family protein [Alphaproteobacteria bacterium]